MTKWQTWLVIVFMALAISTTGYFLGRDKVLGGPIAQNTNFLNTVTHYTTSTYTAAQKLPVKLLARDYNRQYATIINDGATVVYLYLGNVDNTSTTLSGTYGQEDSASTTVKVNNGIRLTASGGYYQKKCGMFFETSYFLLSVNKD